MAVSVIHSRISIMWQQFALIAYTSNGNIVLHLWSFFYFVAKLWIWCSALAQLEEQVRSEDSHRSFSALLVCLHFSFALPKTAQSLSRMKLNQQKSQKHRDTEFVSSVLVVLVLSDTACSGPVCLCSTSVQHWSDPPVLSTLFFLQMTATPWPVRPAVWSSPTTSSASRSARRRPIRRDSCILPSEWPTCCSTSRRWNVPKAMASKRSTRWGAAAPVQFRNPKACVAHTLLGMERYLGWGQQRVPDSLGPMETDLMRPLWSVLCTQSTSSTHPLTQHTDVHTSVCTSYHGKSATCVLMKAIIFLTWELKVSVLRLSH